jgi:serine/threonine-protein kinase RsbT
VREVAEGDGVSVSAREALAIAATELARNIVVHATIGQLFVGSSVNQGGRGVVVIAKDQGPGIADIVQAMADGYTTARGLGLGLPSARRLVDEFEVSSKTGRGTTVTLRKWASTE